MKTIKYLMVGLGIGFICTTFAMLLSMGLNEITTQILAWFLASGAYGVSAIIFDNSKLSLLLKCIIHYLISLSITGIVIFILYRPYAISVAISFTISYFIIFFVMRQIEKRNIKMLNDKLKKN